MAVDAQLLLARVAVSFIHSFNTSYNKDESFGRASICRDDGTLRFSARSPRFFLILTPLTLQDYVTVNFFLI